MKFDKVYLKKSPVEVKEISPLDRVTKQNLDEYAKNWDKWLPK